MKPDWNLLFFIFSAVEVTLPMEYCPGHCQCDWDVYSVSCYGPEVVPVFHPSTQEVWLVGTKLSSIPQDAFANLANISHIYISDDDKIRYLERHSFHNLSRVNHIQLTGMRTLSYIDQEAFKDLPNLKYLGITNTGLTSFPVLQHIHSSQEDFILEIVENVFIQVIPANSFTGISENALTILLNSNGVKEIQRYAFNGSRLEEVYLHRNVDLKRVDEFAFYGVIHGPTHLDLSETKISCLPSIGMENIEKLQAKNTWALKVLPPLRVFLHLQSAELTFPSQCCGFKKLKRWRGDTEAVICNLTQTALGKLQESSVGHKTYQNLKDSFGLPTADCRKHSHYITSPICPTRQSESEDMLYVELPTEHLHEGFDFALCDDLHTDDHGFLCTPLPDALNPCEDVMSHGFLRVLVWVVSLLAISANLLVMFILLTSRQKLSVTRLLMGHLAFADFCMGIYLLLIASVDLYTRSHYYHYAIAWQTGEACSLAGTLSVFASELSVYTLTLISLQRWHAIFYAMRPDRKMRLRHAAVLMLIGWMLCLTLALLPVVGVSSYQKVSICLPIYTETIASRTYVVSVLMINVIAFIVVCLCYLHIYCMVHNPQHQSSRCDTSMAKRMGVLIFTNFLCLAPICFYGLTAALHQPLMTITDSKVLLVLFYPLNSCAHPFFYALLTKAFHRDILMLLSRMGLCQRQAHLYRSQLVSITPTYTETHCLPHSPALTSQNVQDQESPGYTMARNCL
ncbi:thyrotropin receptor-like [Plectropomus leopardus]|uniref:thyrotropin receptor-like n=1 Tax=Plectropomus leopardus TaxID=160734 RepID=UPI001C4D7A9F|nr:thyrotropin receptor-like [Plectropomus leopardus]